MPETCPEKKPFQKSTLKETSIIQYIAIFNALILLAENSQNEWAKSGSTLTLITRQNPIQIEVKLHL